MVCASSLDVKPFSELFARFFVMLFHRVDKGRASRSKRARILLPKWLYRTSPPPPKMLRERYAMEREALIDQNRRARHSANAFLHHQPLSVYPGRWLFQPLPPPPRFFQGGYQYNGCLTRQLKSLSDCCFFFLFLSFGSFFIRASFYCACAQSWEWIIPALNVPPRRDGFILMDEFEKSREREREERLTRNSLFACWCRGMILNSSNERNKRKSCIMVFRLITYTNLRCTVFIFTFFFLLFNI